MNTPLTLEKKLTKREKEGRLRKLVNLEKLVDFYSNDYFGMAKVQFSSVLYQGSTGSRLISGNSNLIEKVEGELANFFEYESGLIFNSGFDANLGIFSSIPEKGDTVIMDSLSHASIRDGVRLSYAKSYTFKHNDLAHLEARLKIATGNIYVVVESIYSMDGDITPLKEISNLCKAFGANLIVDEAHAGGLFGNEGRGILNEIGIDDEVFIKLITFSKAYGSSGSVVLCSKKVREYLINFSRAFIYTSALPDHAIGRIKYVVDLVKGKDKERLEIKENVAFFKEYAQSKNLNLIPSQSGIQSIIIPDINDLVAKTMELTAKGFAVRAISVPTVPEGTERIRICIHSYNTREEIKSLLDNF